MNRIISATSYPHRGILWLSPSEHSHAFCSWVRYRFPKRSYFGRSRQDPKLDLDSTACSSGRGMALQNLGATLPLKPARTAAPHVCFQLGLLFGTYDNLDFLFLDDWRTELRNLWWCLDDAWLPAVREVKSVGQHREHVTVPTVIALGRCITDWMFVSPPDIKHELQDAPVWGCLGLAAASLISECPSIDL